ncbi:ankyrin repeat-containing protein BDA1-like [Senna tora]|uniref:Ankyrin repeat-containing protein BDA1-like n=1 Tax=Senna tora TaxID=362788 RepID=A0A834WWH6_9FABA|nr:ankyrin repeat-containing protein BDA1-like [Senna tora]
MDPRLAKSAQLGDTNALSALLDDDPLILERIFLSPILETPLHIAALAGRVNYARKILSLKPSFAEELNKDGFTPLHIAAATGNIEIVRDLLSLNFGPNLCLLKDMFGLNPLHHAAIRGRVSIIQELVSCCPISAKQVTAQGETVLHLAVKNCQFEAFRVLVKFFEDDDDDGGEVMSSRDKDGRTILEIAMATKQVQVLELLGFQGSNTEKDTNTLQEVLSENQYESPKPTETHNGNSDTTQAATNQEKRIWEDVEQMVLVVASLIATVTYQAGLSPPQTIWKEDMKKNSHCIFHHKRKIYTNPSCPDVTYYLFMPFNTSGFFASALLIFFYRNRSYVRVLLPIALISMMITYITLSVSMSPNALSLLVLYLITLAIFLYCVLAVEVVKKVIKSFFIFASERGRELSKLAFERHKYGDSSAEQA